MRKADIVNLHQAPRRGLYARCTECALNEYCLGRALNSTELEQFEMLKTRRPLPKGSHIFRAHAPLHALYSIRTGNIKTYSIAEDGEEQILGFHSPGDLLGTDAISSGRYVCNAVAINSTSVCMIPYAQLMKFAEHSSNMLRELLRRMSNEIRSFEEIILTLNRKNAEQRIAYFICDLYAHQHRHGIPSIAVILPMSRIELGKYLGLAPETVSRVLTRLRSRGVISTDRGSIQIHDFKALRDLGNSPSEAEMPAESPCNNSACG